MSITHETLELQRRLHGQRIGLLCLALAWIASSLWLALRTPPAPAVLAVERLEILEADGTPAIVLANGQRPIAATIGGQVILQGQEEERRGVPSITFFDGKGDEVGGMAFGVQETPEGYQAVRHLSLDAYQQDQTVVLAHYQNEQGSLSGLMVNDMPTHSMRESMAMLDLDLGYSREQMRAAIEALPEAERQARLNEIFGVSRAFLGSDRNGDAKLVLRDGEGRPRIIIEVPRDGQPGIRILDEKGEVAMRIPQLSAEGLAKAP